MDIVQTQRELGWLLWLWPQLPADQLSYDGSWIPQLGIGLRLGLDGLSLILSLLAALLGLMAVAASWREVQRRAGF